MSKGSWRGRRSATLAACLAGAFAAMALVLSVSLAATGPSSTAKGTASAAKTSSGKIKPKHTGTSLTKSEVITLIKEYAKGATGTKGANGAVGATGAAGPKGESGLKGENGVKGETGTKGETGAHGEAGAVAGYSASQPPTGPDEGVRFTNGTEGSPVTVLSKTLPAGSYMATGKVEVGLAATEPGGYGDAQCSLVDTPASGSPAADVAGFLAATVVPIPFPVIGTLYTEANTLPLDLAVSTSGPSELTIDCWVALSNGGENASKEPGAFIAEASEADIQAVQTTSNS
jgi:hypothetical protein